MVDKISEVLLIWNQTFKRHVICKGIVIAGTRIIEKYWKLNIWHVFENFVMNFGVLKKHVKYLIFNIFW